MSKRRRSLAKLKFSYDFLPDEVIQQIGEYGFFKKSDTLITVMRHFRTLLKVQKRWNNIFSKNYYWLLCSTHLPFSYRPALEPMVICKIDSKASYTSIQRCTYINMVYTGELTQDKQDRIDLLKKFLIDKYILYVIGRRASAVQRKLLKK